MERTDDNSPLMFIFGQGQMIPDFEANLSGKQAGDAFAFGILSENAYGPREEDAIVNIPTSVFAGNEDLLEVGNQVPMRGQHGEQLIGIIMAVEGGEVTMDFNHPMAGRNLHFTGQVLSVREATPSELDHGHVHPHGDHHHH